MARTVARKGVSAGTSETIVRSARGRMGFASNVGRVRPVDEDSVLAMEIRTAFLSEVRTRLLLMVADGMGGHRRGDVASRIAVQTVARMLLPLLTSENEIPRSVYHDGLRLAIDQANQAILAEAQRHPECEGMGTTLSLAISDGRGLHVANAGDSRVYVINGREIFQVTRDHSLVQELVDRGELMPDDQVTPDIGCLTMEPGDNVLVCCDGLINHVEDDDIHRVVVEASDPQTACEILVSLANRGGGTDNISVIIARVPTDSP